MMNVKTILCVENDPVSQTGYQKRLEHEGFRLERAQDGQVALDILSERPPDLVLLDPMLPKVSGADVLKFMDADPRLATVPVIIFSNTAMTEMPLDGTLAQSAKRLLKSECTFPKLLATIQESLAAGPEFVVVEADNTSSARSAQDNNGDHRRQSVNVFTTEAPLTDNAKKQAEFLNDSLAIRSKIREHSTGYIRAPGSETGRDHLSGLHDCVQLLNNQALQAGCARVGLLTTPFEALLAGILNESSRVTLSVLQTIAEAVNCLDDLLKNNDGYVIGPPIHAKVLVVDDDAVCNQVSVSSLKRANFDAASVKDPAAALILMGTSQYDLVVLDINMPEMSGFEVCEKMRRLPHCKKTPVIFLTAFSDLQNRKRGMLSGGNDFVSKPVSPLELALTVSINLIKARVHAVHAPRLETNSQPTNDSRQTLQPEPQTGAEVLPAKSSSKLAPPAEPHVKDAQTADPENQTQPKPEPHSVSPPKPTHQSQTSSPTSQPSNEETAGAEIHDRLRHSADGLEQAKAGLKEESSERARMESQWREQLSAAKALIEQTETALKEKEARCSQLEKELAGMKLVRDGLQNKFAAEQQATAKSQQENRKLEERLRQSAAELERAQAGLEQESQKRVRLESEYQNLADAKEALNQELEALRKRQTARDTELRNKQKSLGEGLRENIHLLQLRLQELEAFSGNSGPSANGESNAH